MRKIIDYCYRFLFLILSTVFFTGCEEDKSEEMTAYYLGFNYDMFESLEYNLVLKPGYEAVDITFSSLSLSEDTQLMKYRLKENHDCVDTTYVFNMHNRFNGKKCFVLKIKQQPLKK